ncbi:hypothetical protein DV517_74570 [Streptomyces sp. S816]|nr:hypothetical protein DV517_74570 [Streptomyces sp. S816]
MPCPQRRWRAVRCAPTCGPGASGSGSGARLVPRAPRWRRRVAPQARSLLFSEPLGLVVIAMADRALVIVSGELEPRRAAGVIAVRPGGVLADAGAVRAACEAVVDGGAVVEVGVELGEAADSELAQQGVGGEDLTVDAGVVVVGEHLRGGAPGEGGAVDRDGIAAGPRVGGGGGRRGWRGERDTEGGELGGDVGGTSGELVADGLVLGGDGAGFVSAAAEGGALHRAGPCSRVGRVQGRSRPSPAVRGTRWPCRWNTVCVASGPQEVR